MKPKHILWIACAALAAAGAVAASLRGNPRVDTVTRELATIVKDEKDQSPLAMLIRAERQTAARRRTVVFATPCFWSGEGYFGLLEGVYRTTPGFLAGEEVVEVEYDPEQLGLAALVEGAREAGKASRVYCRTEADLVIAKSVVREDAMLNVAAMRLDHIPKWYLQQTPLKALPLTEAQSTRVNAYLHARRPIEPLLSPAQRQWTVELIKDDKTDWRSRAGSEGLCPVVRLETR